MKTNNCPIPTKPIVYALKIFFTQGSRFDSFQCRFTSKLITESSFFGIGEAKERILVL